MKTIDIHAHWYPEEWLKLFEKDGPKEGAKLERKGKGFVVHTARITNAFTDEFVDVGLRDGLALRWSFMGPFETIDLNAPGGVRDYAERYQDIYDNIFPSTQHRVDWSGPVMDVVEADRSTRLPRDRLAERQAWRDGRLMALLAHKRRAETESEER